MEGKQMYLINVYIFHLMFFCTYDENLLQNRLFIVCLFFSCLSFESSLSILNEDSKTYSKKFMNQAGSQSLRKQEYGEFLYLLLLNGFCVLFFSFFSYFTCLCNKNF